MRSLLTHTPPLLCTALHCCTIQNDEDDGDSDDDDVHAILCYGFVVAATTAMPPSYQRERDRERERAVVGLFHHTTVQSVLRLTERSVYICSRLN